MKPIYIGEVEITPRELLFSVTIIAVLIGIGIWIVNPILRKTNEKALAVISAVEVSDSEKFGYIKRTNVGNFLAEGEMSTVNPVSIPDIEGQYLSIKKDKERYTMHVETYTTTDSKGRTTVHTRTYWSWDVVDSEKWEADSVLFLGEKFALDSIKYHPHRTHNTTIKDPTNSNLRYVYYTHPENFNGLLRGVADNKTFTELSFNRDGTIEAVVSKAERRTHNSPIVFWVFWWIFIIIVVGVFFALENYWLED